MPLIARESRTIATPAGIVILTSGRRGIGKRDCPYFSTGTSVWNAEADQLGSWRSQTYFICCIASTVTYALNRILLTDILGIAEVFELVALILSIGIGQLATPSAHRTLARKVCSKDSQRVLLTSTEFFLASCYCHIASQSRAGFISTGGRSAKR